MRIGKGKIGMSSDEVVAITSQHTGQNDSGRLFVGLPELSMGYANSPLPRNWNAPCARLPTFPLARHSLTIAVPVSVSPDIPDVTVMVTVVFTICALLLSGVPLAGIRWPHDMAHVFRPAMYSRHEPCDGLAVSI